jgi:putative MATE family efflux protein
MKTPSRPSQHRQIWSLAWPQTITLLLNFLIGFVDVWVAGQIDHRLQASLGIITQGMFLFLIVSNSVAGGAVAAISQSLGGRKTRRAERYTGLCLSIAAGSGSAFLVLCLPLTSAIVTAMQAPEEIVPVAEYALRIFLFTLPAYSMLIMQGAVFRARRQVMLPLFATMLVTAVNTVGDIGFGLGLWGLPALGVAGVVWSTFVSIAVGAAFGFVVLWRDGTVRRSNFAPWKWVRRAAPYLLKVALPSGAIQLLWQFGYLVIFAITARLPEGSVAALAGMAAGARVEALLLLPAYAMNMTASILVGHMLGDHRPDEARRTGLRILLVGIACVVVIGVCVWPFLGDIAAFLSPRPDICAETESYLAYNVLALPFTLTTLILAGALAGSGATIYNLVGVGSGTWLVRIPLACLLGLVVMKTSTGIWISMLASQASQAAVLLFIFMKLDWQRHALSGKGNLTKK